MLVLMHILTFVWNSNLRRTGHQTCQLHIITQTVNLFYSPQIHSSIMLSLHIANNSTPYIWILSHQDLRRHERARHTAYDRLQITKCIFTQIFHAFSSLCVKILWHISSSLAKERGYNFFINGYVHAVILFSSTDKILDITTKCYRSLRKNEDPHKINMTINLCVIALVRQGECRLL